ncbi:hypothetical protein ABPG75_010587 [Micractinium tetrahymenae]
MPPQQGTAVAAGVAPTIADLPDELLARCLEPLDQKQRLKDAALACKQFLRACLALPLDVSIRGSLQTSAAAQLLARLLALRAFLSKHAPPVRSLRFFSSAGGAAGQEEMAALAACLALCTAASSPLQRLDIFAPAPLPLSRLVGLPGLRQLKHLTLRTWDAPLRLPAGCSQLAVLAELELAGEVVQLEGPALPPAITRLWLEDRTSTQLPRQLLSLRSLARLELECRALETGSLRLLAGVPSLMSLYCSSVEAPLLAGLGLEAVTQLQQLEAGLSPEDVAGLDATLPALQRLRTLSLYCLDFQRRTLPFLASLPRLQRLCIDYDLLADAEPEGGDSAPSLPPGPWLASLHWLAAPWRTLQASAAVLHSATALQHLSCFYLPEPVGEDAEARASWAGFWSCLELLPALRCLCIHTFDNLERPPLPPAATHALLALVTRRPALRWHLTHEFTPLPALLAMTDIPASLDVEPLEYVY